MGRKNIGRNKVGVTSQMGRKQDEQDEDEVMSLIKELRFKNMHQYKL